MKPSLSYFKHILAFLFISSCTFLHAQYKISDILAENKVKIQKPYKYDGFLMNEFKFDLINKDVHAEFTAFESQKYKLIFCSSGFEETVTIRIYDKSKPSIKVAEQIIDAKTRTWTFEPPSSATYSIVYEISPSNTDVEHPGCMVMMIGFKGK